MIIFSENFVNIVIYPCSQRSFRHGRLHVFQLLYSIGCRRDWPLARDTLTATSLAEFSGH
ncbi:MAG: hypothetical protein AVO38_07380 [delta proteobacterium ML8_D]|nr:MAG: hypothetical protein AVO38_07380 [delta proteobacterium ML8_D]